MSKKNWSEEPLIARVLILEQNQHFQTFYSDIFTQNNYLPFAVDNINAATREIKNGTIDIVLTSMNAAQEIDNNFLQHIQSKHPIIPVVIIARHDQTAESADEISDIQADTVLYEPVDARKLLIAIDQIISSAH